jgi:tetratricopeptide (TPR) repeat protein
LDFENAMNDVERCISIEPENTIGYYLKGKLLTKMGNYLESLEQYDLLIELDPRFVDAYFEKGRLLIDIGRVNEAIEEVK